MNKAFDNFTWNDAPSTTTPLSSQNLNKINSGLNTVDNRVIALDTSVTNLGTSKEDTGKITIGGTAYNVRTSTTDAGTAGYITFVI